MSTKNAPRGLGRGLDALLGAPAQRKDLPPEGAVSPGATVRVDRIAPQRGQPRRVFDKARLDELAQSIREHGLIEPLVLRRLGGEREQYEIIAGERRWRASQRAGLVEVPAVVRDATPKQAFELALVENIQREDLNGVELAEALRKLLDEHGYTQEALAERLGKDRSTISNALRLLNLPEPVRNLVLEGKLTEGHARALLGATDAATIVDLAEKVVRGRLSVRDAEKLARAAKKAAKAAPGPKSEKNVSTRDLELRLTRRLGTRCEVRDRKGQGVIVVQYASLDELDRLIELLL